VTPDDPWPRAGRAAALAELREFAAAVEETDRVVKLDRRYGFGWSIKAIAHLSLDELDEALDALDRAIECDDAAGWAWATRAAVRGLMGGTPGEQVVDLSRAVALDPNDLHARVALGFALLRQGAAAVAREHFEWVTEQGTQAPAASATLLNGSAWAMLGLARWDGAAEVCAEVTTIDPQDVEFHVDYGLAVLCATAADPEDEPDLVELETALYRARHAEDVRVSRHLLRSARRNIEDLEVAAAGQPPVLAALADARRAVGESSDAARS
jgi:tetratricopeptide (TPR) repeat protein